MTTTAAPETGRLGEVVLYFLRLGLLGFGGPVALVGQMERELVSDRKWLSKEQMREAIAICQSLPGPLAIQVGIYISYLRAGFWGAWAGGWAFIFQIGHYGDFCWLSCCRFLGIACFHDRHFLSVVYPCVGCGTDPRASSWQSERARICQRCLWGCHRHHSRRLCSAWENCYRRLADSAHRRRVSCSPVPLESWQSRADCGHSCRWLNRLSDSGTELGNGQITIEYEVTPCTTY
jgi:hypothetical protein